MTPKNGNESFVTMSECVRTHAENDRRLEIITKTLREMNARLYQDNGNLSIQTRLDRQARILSMLCWIMTIVGGALIVATMSFFGKTILKVWFP